MQEPRHSSAPETWWFPTETVYGLGANALDAAAVHKIFALKAAIDKPADRPCRHHWEGSRFAGDWPDAAIVWRKNIGRARSL